MHSPIHRRLMVPAGLALVFLAPIAALWPKALAWPLGLFALWVGIALLIRAAKTPGPPS